MGRPVAAALVNGSGARVTLTDLLARPDRVRATVPAGTPAGSWDVEVTTPSGTDLLPHAVEITAAPLQFQALNVGQGDATIVRVPGGRSILIDGSIANTGTRLRAELPTPPDWIVVSHFDADHLSGVYEYLAGPDGLPNTADDVDPGVAVLDHGDNHACKTQLCQKYLSLRARLEAAGKARAAVAGEVLSLGGGVRAHTLFVNGRFADGRRAFTSTENENSVGMVFEFGGFLYYSAGDTTGGEISGCPVALSSKFADVETPAARLVGLLDAMKVSHHGSCTGIPLGFSALTVAQVGLLSVGTNNSYCHPSQRVPGNLSNLGGDVLLTAPGVVDPNNNSGCPLTVLPARAAPVYGNLALSVPGDGTFTATATGVSQSWSRSYTVRAPESASHAPALEWPLPPGVTFPQRAAASTSGTFSLTLAEPALGTDAVLLPWSAVSDAAVDAVEAGTVPGAALAAQVTVAGASLSVTPAAPLALRRDYALVLPSRTTGRTAAVVAFTSGQALPPGATHALAPPASSPSGALLDLPSVTVTFSDVVTGVGPQSLFLEELDSSLEAVFGTVVPAGDGKTFTLQLPPTSRVGPGGASCESLCPGLTYAVRVSGLVQDAQGVPVDTAAPVAFLAGTCADASAPTLAAPELRPFPAAVSIAVRGDEPITGEVWLAPDASFSTDCGANPTSACRRLPFSTGSSCVGTPCVPAAASCGAGVTFTGLTPGVGYRYEIRAKDLVGKSPVTLPTGTVTPASGPALVLTEALYDSPTATESVGEYVEVFNAGDADANVCLYKIGTPSASAFACSGTLTVPAGGYAVLGGTNFCNAATASCAANAWSLPDGARVASGIYAGPISGGLSNSTPPTLQLSLGGTVVSTVPGGAPCPEGQSRTRLVTTAPDLAPSFECRPGTPAGPTP
jgi:hypothetical protein